MLMCSVHHHECRVKIETACQLPASIARFKMINLQRVAKLNAASKVTALVSKFESKPRYRPRDFGGARVALMSILRNTITHQRFSDN
jgi:hypothetical protein